MEGITSTYYAFLLKYRDAKNVTLWIDHFATQNKNWTLLSFIFTPSPSIKLQVKASQLPSGRTSHETYEQSYEFSDYKEQFDYSSKYEFQRI